MLLSAQVLAEFAATLLHKMSPPARPEGVAAVLDALGPIRVVFPDADMVRRAVEGLRPDSSTPLTGDQKYFGIIVENPFR